METASTPNIDVETEQVQVSSSSTGDANESLKLAISMALFRSKLLQKQPKPPNSDALKWKRKVKERKQLILRLKHDLKQAEDGIQCDLFPQRAACKCYFFQNLGKVSPNFFGDDSTFNDVLRRRFLRQVQFNERRKRRNADDEIHKHCSPELQHTNADAQVRVQHLIRKLGSEPNVGQRVILSVSQRISVLAESFIFMDPFEMFFRICTGLQLIQLIEFLVSGHLVAWSSADHFDSGLFEEWVASLLRAQKTVKLLESRNGLYILYLDRVIERLFQHIIAFH